MLKMPREKQILKIGSLCTGYGGLDLAVEAHFNAETIWCAEFDKYASQVIEQRFGIPNYGDIKTIKWEELPKIDILTAGYPCQPFSHAGERKGTNDPRHIFPFIAKAIDALQPKYFIFENVRGHLSLGFKEVLEILAPMGYIVKWGLVRASDAGAPHRRERLFIFGSLKSTDTNGIGFEFRKFRTQWNQGQPQLEPTECCQTSSNADCDSCAESRRANRGLSKSTSEVIDRSNWNEYGSGSKTITDTSSERLQRTWNETGNFADGDSTSSNANSTGRVGSMQRLSSGLDSCFNCNANDEHKSHDGQMQKLRSRFASRCEMSMQTAPNPLVDGKLNAKFVEYMMGLPEGWVTDCGLSRSQQLKMLGNGVVPQQAKLALELLTNGTK